MDLDSEKVYTGFSGPLKGFIANRISNAHDAEDILQEIFLKIHKNMDSLQDSQKITPWIYQIARNAIADYYRKQGRQGNLPVAEGGMAEGPESLHENSEMAACLQSMIGFLPDIYKEAILLTEFGNLTQRELSERTGLSLSGAKSRVRRARKMLKDMLLGCCVFEFDHMGNIVDYKRRKENCTFC